MKSRNWLAIGCLATALSVCAQEKLPTLKVGSEVYSNVTVLSKSATDIYFTHARGMGNAKLKNLEPDFQKRFGYDPAKGRETEKNQFAANLAYVKDLLAAKLAGRPAPGSVSNRPALEPRAARRSSPGAPPPLAPVPRPDPIGDTANGRAIAEDIEPVRPVQGEATAVTDIPVREIHAQSFRGRLAPEFVVEKWLTAEPDYAGKYLLIDFWATWAVPCRRSITVLNELHAKFKDRLVIVGLSDESEDEVRQMKSPQIDYYVAIDTSGSMRSAVGVRRIPHAILMDPQGIVRFEGHPGYLTGNSVAGLLARYSD